MIYFHLYDQEDINSQRPIFFFFQYVFNTEAHPLRIFPELDRIAGELRVEEDTCTIR